MPKREITKQQRMNIVHRILRLAPEEGFSSKDVLDRYLAQGNEEVDIRTIKRDLLELCHQGMVLITSQDDDVDEVKGDNTQKRFAIDEYANEDLVLKINEGNLQTLLLALSLLKKLGPKGIEKKVVDTENVICSCLTEDLQKKANEIQEMQAIQASGPGKDLSPNDEDIHNVMLALRKKRIIEGIYDSKNSGKRKREFGPISLELFGGTPYVIVEDFAEENQDERYKRIKVSRFTETKVLKNKNYTAPERSKLEEFFKSSFAGVGGKNSQIQHIVIKGNEKLAEHFSGIELHPSQKLTVISDNECEVTFDMAESYPFYRYVAGLGKWITRIEPIDVMRQVRAIWRDGAKNMGLVVEWPERE